MILAMPLRRLVQVVAAILLGAAVLPAGASGTTRQHAEWTAVAPGTAPAADAEWAAVALPVLWAAPANGGPLHGAVLRLNFDVPQPPQRQLGLLLTQLPTGGRVRVNGHLVGDIATDDEGREAMWRRPFLFPLAAPVLATGRNTVTIKIAYGDGTHRVGEIVVAPVDQLTGARDLRYFFTNTVPWIGATLAALIALFFGLLLLRRPDGLLALLAIAGVLWLVYSALLLLELHPAWLHPVLIALCSAGLGGFMAVTAITLMRLAHRRLLRAEAALWIFTAAGPTLMLATRATSDAALAGAWLVGLAVALAATLLYAGQRRLRGNAAPGGALLAATALLVLAAVHDGALTLGLPIGTDLPLLPVAGPLVLVALATPLVDRFFRALREAETARSEMESRVREREQLLKRNFEWLRESERAQARNQERQRIMQDIHDGLGSQLLSALMLVERRALSNRQVAQLLRESIDDLRLAIDAIASEEATLADALGNLRFRMEPRLRAAGIGLAWDVRGLPAELQLDPGVVLPILRIVQEALTNALKHSRARAVCVEARVDGWDADRFLRVRVTDDGRGIGDEGVRGRGLLNMRSRAAKIGAQLSLTSAPGAGTTVAVDLKLAAEPGPRAGEPSKLNTNVVLEQARRL
jgi:signal transduction histidine kinase